MAKEGYVNLHLAHQKNSKQPGDSEAMMKSRRAFLNQGYYQKLVARLSDLLPVSCHSLLDLGCGEGYYLEQLIQEQPSRQIAGIDISKAGVRLAAKRKSPAQLSVASAYELPFFDSSFDATLSIFSPISPAESARILKPGGILLTVGPGPMHLHQLAALIYETPNIHEPGFQDLHSGNLFVNEYSEALQYSAEVSGENCMSLLKMTPYYWHARPEQIQYIESLSCLDIAFQFEIHLFKKV